MDETRLNVSNLADVGHPSEEVVLINKQEERERERFVMEIVLEEIEDILWSNPEAGLPDFVQMILDKAKERGAEVSVEQKEFIERKIQEWIDDVGEQIEAQKQLYLDGCLEEFEFGSEEFDQAWNSREVEFDKAKEPWRLIEDNEFVKRGLLVRMGLPDLELDDISISADHPPFVVVQLNIENYATVRNQSVTSLIFSGEQGAYSNEFPFIPTVSSDRPQGLEGLKGNIIVMVKGVEDKFRIHEEQHAIYNKYMAPGKKGREQRISFDELAAYLKSGDYDFSERGIFSGELAEGYHVYKIYSPEWIKIKNRLMNLKWHSVPVSDIWPKVALANDFSELAERLDQIVVDSTNFHPDDKEVQVLPWFVESHQNQPQEYYEKIQLKLRKYLDNFLLKWSSDISTFFESAQLDKNSKLYLINQALEYCSHLLNTLGELFPELKEKLIYQGVDEEIPDEQRKSDYNSISSDLNRVFKDFVDEFVQSTDELDFELPELNNGAENFEILRGKIEKISTIFITTCKKLGII